MDVQRAEIEFPAPPRGSVATRRGAPSAPESLALLADALRSAHRPLILAGGGVPSAQAADLLRRYVAFIGLLSEYIGAIHTQGMARAPVVERERINFEDPKKMPV